jgi:hypothetical protein
MEMFAVNDAGMAGATENIPARSYSETDQTRAEN